MKGSIGYPDPMLLRDQVTIFLVYKALRNHGFDCVSFQQTEGVKTSWIQ